MHEKNVMSVGKLRSHSTIMERQWKTLTTKPEHDVVIIVRNFYANMKNGTSYSTVRGKKIKVEPPTINALGSPTSRMTNTDISLRRAIFYVQMI